MDAPTVLAPTVIAPTVIVVPRFNNKQVVEEATVRVVPTANVVPIAVAPDLTTNACIDIA